MIKGRFEWDDAKDRANQKKHRLSFSEAQFAFADPNRVIARDLEHSKTEERFYCFGRLNDGIATVRFTYREGVIRIYGSGYRRKGKRIYERENQIQR
jgi:uncharacterized DUF497 family protein